ncbi:ferric reductase-like transmembrane domain-containing protein [Deinococcus sonorensis]|uniref:Ferric reductase-like transmembrane domain-containing protein n=2 Tax=Deinococcus sonorensis TaxID=309891 RepID=A0AAU7UFR4_9DEIO
MRAPPRRPASGWVQLAVALLLPLNLDLLLQLLQPAELLQRREEVYGALSLVALLLVLLTRHLPALRPYRRALGLAGFGYALIHGWLAILHVFHGDLSNVLFLNPATQAGVGAGLLALVLLLPLALTSTDAARRRMGRHWKTLHRLGPPLTLLSAVHTAWIGVHFSLWPLTWGAALLLALSVALYVWPRRRPPVPVRRPS